MQFLVTSSLCVYRGSEQTSGKIIFKKIEFANRVTLSLRDEPRQIILFLSVYLYPTFPIFE